MDRLSDRWSYGRNSFGLMRMALTLGVLVSHSFPIGFGALSPGENASSGQTELGSLSLYGLLIVSGFLNTDSGLRIKTRKFLWHRGLRVFPGFWVCLLVTAFVFAPIAALVENGTLRGFWTHSDGPFAYVATNWFVSMNQFPISGLLSNTPFGKLTGGPSGFDGSLWTLRYEFGCYAVIAVLIATGILRKHRMVVVLLAALAYVLVVRQLINSPTWFFRPFVHGSIGPIPLLGSFELTWVVYLGYLFFVGSLFRLYMDRIPMHWSLALLALLILGLTFWRGGLFAIGLPAEAYLLVYLVVSLPERATRFGRKRDYSYGFYIYAFPVQQLVALMGGNRFGAFVYIAIVFIVCLPLAAGSWHLIERRSLDLKRRQFSFVRRRGPVQVSAPEPVPAVATEVAPVTP